MQVCSSYPANILVPSEVQDCDLQVISEFRQGGRFPFLAYTHESGVRKLPPGVFRWVDTSMTTYMNTYTNSFFAGRSNAQWSTAPQPGGEEMQRGREAPQYSFRKRPKRLHH